MTRVNCNEAPVNIDEKLRLVKSACDAAPADYRKTWSLRIFMSAEQALKLGYKPECIRRLDAAMKALK